MGSDQPVSLYTALTNPFPYIPRSFIDAGVNGVGSFIGLWSVPGLAGNEPCNKGWQAAWQAGAPVRACLAGRGASQGMLGRQGYLHSSQGMLGRQGRQCRHGMQGSHGRQAGLLTFQPGQAWHARNAWQAWQAWQAGQPGRQAWLVWQVGQPWHACIEGACKDALCVCV